nr:protein p7 [Norway rat hepacivirus 2]
VPTAVYAATVASAYGDVLWRAIVYLVICKWPKLRTFLSPTLHCLLLMYFAGFVRAE